MHKKNSSSKSNILQTSHPSKPFRFLLKTHSTSNSPIIWNNGKRFYPSASRKAQFIKVRNSRYQYRDSQEHLSHSVCSLLRHSTVFKYFPAKYGSKSWIVQEYKSSNQYKFKARLLRQVWLWWLRTFLSNHHWSKFQSQNSTKTSFYDFQFMWCRWSARSTKWLKSFFRKTGMISQIDPPHSKKLTVFWRTQPHRIYLSLLLWSKWPIFWSKVLIWRFSKRKTDGV